MTIRTRPPSRINDTGPREAVLLLQYICTQGLIFIPKSHLHLLPRVARVSSFLMFRELGNPVYGTCPVTEIRPTKFGIKTNNGTTCPRPTWLGRTRYAQR